MSEKKDAHLDWAIDEMKRARAERAHLAVKEMKRQKAKLEKMGADICLTQGNASFGKFTDTMLELHPEWARLPKAEVTHTGDDFLGYKYPAPWEAIYYPSIAEAGKPDPYDDLDKPLIERSPGTGVVSSKLYEELRAERDKLAAEVIRLRAESKRGPDVGWDPEGLGD